MGKKRKAKCIGILTAGGDCPGLNPAIRAVVKAAAGKYGMDVVGVRDGFRGLVENRTFPMKLEDASGLLTLGGTILGTSREKPNKYHAGDQEMDMTEAAVEHYHDLHMDVLICLGGGGTQKNAYHLMKEGGIKVITLPKTIDNDVWGTDVSFGYDTALTVATEAIDRLHSTAESHHRIMVVEIMGHKVGWLALAAGVAGGADVILIPEIPYDVERVGEAVIDRNRAGKRFSIVALAEGAEEKQESKKAKAGKNKSKDSKAPDLKSYRLAQKLEKLTGLETRFTALGHVQRGGTPTPTDRLIASRLGTAAAELAAQGQYGCMVAVRGDACAPVPLGDVAGKLKEVPPDHPLLDSARLLGTCLGE